MMVARLVDRLRGGIEVTRRGKFVGPLTRKLPRERVPRKAGLYSTSIHLFCEGVPRWIQRNDPRGIRSIANSEPVTENTKSHRAETSTRHPYSQSRAACGSDFATSLRLCRKVRSIPAFLQERPPRQALLYPSRELILLPSYLYAASNMGQISNSAIIVLCIVAAGVVVLVCGFKSVNATHKLIA